MRTVVEGEGDHALAGRKPREVGAEEAAPGVEDTPRQERVVDEIPGQDRSRKNGFPREEQQKSAEPSLSLA